jgi:hypothetical protein
MDDLVVDQWVSDDESSSHHDSLFLHDVCTTSDSRSSRKIIQQYQWLEFLPLNPVEPEKGLFIMQEFKAYAASRAKGPLEPFSFTPGPLGPEEVEIKVLTRG